MRLIIRDALTTFTLTMAISIGLVAAQEHQHPGTHPEGGAHRHPAAAALKNPVAADATSIAAGKQLYDKQCAGCHGDSGKGDGSMGEELNPKPANLADADWKHGSSDGEIFTVIRDGVKNTGMKPYSRKLTTHQIWDVVNYVRSLAAH
jgi:mono/diheme cytochrome c family protein